MERRPLVAVTCCWVMGVSILSLFQGLDAALAMVSLLLLLVGTGLLYTVNWKLLLVCVLALLLSSGERLWIERGNISDIPANEAAIGNEVTLRGYISSDVEVDGDLVMFRLKAQEIQLSQTAPKQSMSDTVVIRVKLAEESEQQTANMWKRGDTVQLKGEMKQPGDAGNFGAFDYRSYLKKQGIHWQLNVKGTNSVTHIQEKIDLRMKCLRVLDDFRRAIGALMDRMYPHGDSGYMKGLVVGIRSDLNPEQFDDFARLGLTHVLAISGLHVGVIVFLLLQFGAWMRLTRERTLDMTIALMPIYMMITGASPSAVRACLMAMLALWLARRHALKDGLHLLSAAALLMLIWNPSLIADVSFQLSFIVTAGLLLFVPTVTESLPFRWKWLRGAIAVTLTAQVVSFPLTAYYFHSVHLLSLPANLLLVPFISFIVMPLGMASIAMGAIWLPLGIIPAKLATMGNHFTFAIVERLSRFEELRTVWPQTSLLWVIIAYMLMGAGIVLLKRRIVEKKDREWWISQSADASLTIGLGEMTAPLVYVPAQSDENKRKSRILKLSIAVIGLGWLIWGYQLAILDRSATVSFINVGQGDCILIRTGKGKHILIDTGGTINFRKPGEEWRERRDPYEIGRKLLVPLLLKRGVRDLDALVLTHLDADHMGGARAVIDQIPVRAILFNGTVKDAPASNNMFQLALDKGIPFYAVHAPMEWEVDQSTTLSALYPAEDLTGESDMIKVSSDQNERSIVLLITIYERLFLLPGDLESKGEQAVVEAQINAGETMQRHIDVLKAGHHGSKTSTTQAWLNYWQPQETVISAGLNNLYGHPHPTVMQRLFALGSAILRTDLDGEIQYRISADGTMARRTLYSRVENKDVRVW
ncbi:DNA internalization-related competence protein ComEC/Rec2 [Cohnella sp.]|uniref:DNA internalization-related competence protein ComEC/Rec2 n=1 Tax=Cohnella sp. TaxID=1883426 RepID=UPI00356265D8